MKITHILRVNVRALATVMTQMEIAEKLGTSQTTISRLCSDKPSTMYASTAERLLKAVSKLGPIIERGERIEGAEWCQDMRSGAYILTVHGIEVQRTTLKEMVHEVVVVVDWDAINNQTADPVG